MRVPGNSQDLEWQRIKHRIDGRMQSRHPKKRAMDTLIIKVCLNASRGRENNLNVPLTPEEVANGDDVIRAYC